jgi:hypothetical protein
VGSNQDPREQTQIPIPLSGHFDGLGKTYPARQVRDAIVGERVRGEAREDLPDAPRQLTLSQITVREPLDLSFEALGIQLIFDRCRLAGGLIARRANLAGLELYATEVPVVDLSWSHIDGDLRLIKVSPPRADPPAADADRDDEGDSSEQGGGADSDPATGEPTSLRCYGTKVTGEVGLAGSEIREDDYHALLATKRLAAAADSPTANAFTWERLFNAIGLASALVLWVAVVGGATLWARLEAIGAPALPSLTALGQTWIVTAGLQTLMVPILLGTSVAVLVYFSRPTPLPTAHPAGSFDTAMDADVGRRDSSVRPARATFLSLVRSRPVVALLRLQRRPSSRLLVPAVFFALVAASLYIARASLPALAVTAAVIGVSILAALLPDGFRRPWIAVVVAVITAVLVYEGWRWATDKWALLAAVLAGVSMLILLLAAGWEARPDAFVVAALLVVFVGAVLSFLLTVTLGWTVFMAVITALAVWISLGALMDKPQGAAALTLFVAIVAWSGALQYAKEIGNREPAFPEASLAIENAAPVAGLLVGRTSDLVLLAEMEPTDGAREVHVYPADQIESVTIGSQVTLDPSTKRVSDTEADGTGPNDDVSKDDVPEDGVSEEDGETQPMYEPPVHDPFEAADAIDTLDAEVAGAPVRLELLGVRRSDEVVYVWMRVVNMDQAPHSVAEMLALDRGALDTPLAIDTGSRLAYHVAQTPSSCACTNGLDALELQAHAQVNVFAAHVLPASVTSVDISLPTLGSFDRVAIQ